MLQQTATTITGLTLHQLQFTIGKSILIDNISCQIKRPCNVALVGLNGAGKSSLIKLLVGELVAQKGAIRYQTNCGMSLSPFEQLFKAKLGYQAPSMTALGCLSVNEYLQLCCRLKSLSELVAEQQIKTISRQWNLTGLLSLPVDKLSQGNQQKVAIAQAFLGEPDCIFLDEPTQNLDPVEQKRFLDNLNRQANSAICLFSSHHINEAVEAANIVLMLHKGMLVAQLNITQNNEVWLVTSLSIAQINHLLNQEDIAQLSYRNKKNLIKILINNPIERQQMMEKLRDKDPKLIDLSSAEEALMPLFSLLATESL